ncbi:C40 family peptidase [Patescibacteria group bacterium]|nr:C40 family peptidase [Patescibacteria group bacterium]
MKISYNWLQSYFAKKLPKPEKVAEVLTMHSFEVESVEPLDIARGKRDFVFNIDVLPNRAHDCLSHYGIAKELAAIMGISNFKFLISKKFPISKISKSVNLKVENQNLCRRAMKRVVEGVKIGESPKWLKERLISIGQKPINNIVDATNFVIFELGQPVHAFDFDKLYGEQNKKDIVIKNVPDKEKIITLDDKKYELDKDVVVISDTQKSLDIAGIKGGKNSGIEKNTKNLVLSVCNFDPINIRKTSKKLGLVTDASIRFENGITPELAEKAMDRMTEIILKTAGGKVGPKIDFYPRKPCKYVLGIHPMDVEKNLGIHIPEKEIIDILKRLGFEIKKIKPITNILKLAKSLKGKPYKYGASVSFDAPEFFDCSSFTSYVFSQSGVQIPRMTVDQYFFGYAIAEQDIKPGDVVFSSSGNGKIHYESKEFMKGSKIKEGIDHCGIYLGNGKIIHATRKNKEVVIEDFKKSLSFKNLRGIRRMISENDDLLVIIVPFERLDITIKEDLIEEIARIYGYEKIPSKLPEEVLIPATSNENYEYANLIRNILAGAGFSEVYNYSFTDKGDIEISNPIAKDKNYLRSNLLDGLNANIRENSRYFKDIKIFEIGKIFPAGGETISLAGAGLNTDFYEIKGVVEMLLERLGLDDFYFADASAEALAKADIRVGNTSIGHIDHGAFEINFEMLVRMADEQMEYMPISRYPAAQRDIAIFIPFNTKVIEVMDIIENTAGELLVDTDLFDIYENEERKSFAFHLIFQSQKKTLTDKEINALMNKIMDALDANPEWEVRR